MNISFAMTAQKAAEMGLPDPLLNGIKTVTRRNWTDNTFSRIANSFDHGNCLHEAWSNCTFVPGAKRLGHLFLTSRPYREALKDMPESDVYHEGNLWRSKDEFIKFLGRPGKVVTVIRFKFTPLKPLKVVLTPKEKEVYDLLVIGNENKRIAEKLGNSIRTIETHVSTILSKSGLATRYQIAANLYPEFIEVSKSTPSHLYAFSNHG